MEFYPPKTMKLLSQNIVVILLVSLPNCIPGSDLNYFYNQGIMFPLLSLNLLIYFLLAQNFKNTILFSGPFFALILSILPVLLLHCLFKDNLYTNHRYLLLLYETGIVYLLVRPGPSPLQKPPVLLASYILQTLFLYHIIQGLLIKNTAHQFIGCFNNPNVCAGYLAYLSVFSFENLLSERNHPFLKAVSLSNLLLAALIICINQSRTAILILFIFSVFLPWRRPSLNIGKLLGLCFLPVLAFLLFLLKPESSAGRLFIWKTSLSAITGGAFSGCGLNLFSKYYNVQQAKFFSSHPNAPEARLADHVSYAYNEFLQFAMELGCFVFLWILFFFLLFLARVCRRRTSLSLTAFCLAFLVDCLTGFPIHLYPPISVFLLMIIRDKYENKPALVASLRYGLKAYYFIFIVNLGCSCWLIRYCLALARWKKTVTGSMVSENRLESTAGVLKDNEYFLYTTAFALSENGFFERSNRLLSRLSGITTSDKALILAGDNCIALDSLEQAGRSYLLAYQCIPNRLIPQYKLLRLYDYVDRKPRAIYWAEMIRATEVKIRSPVTDSILLFANTYLIQNSRK
jgi:hypothetical protein